MNEKRRMWIIIGVMCLLLLAYVFDNKILDYVLGPLLRLPSFFSIIIMSLGITLVMTLVYKWMTDQTLMKSLREQQKKFQDDMKKNRQDTKKVMEIQKKAMGANMQYMMHSFRPTLVTFIPIILIFAWMTTNLAYSPLVPGQNFMVTAKFQNPTGTALLEVPQGLSIIGDDNKTMLAQMQWNLKGDSGKYDFNISYGTEKYSKTVLIDNQKYFEPIKRFSASNLKEVDIGYTPTRVFGHDFSIWGWHPGWFFLYFISAIIFSFALRKMLNIY